MIKSAFIDPNSGETNRISNEDDVELARMGYKQLLYRGFNGFMNWSFCYTSVAVMASISVTISSALNAGGSSVILYCWIIGSFFTIIVGLSMAEICSTYPAAGSVYHWAGSLAPKGYEGVFSFYTGWFNLLGNSVADAAYAYLFAQLVASASQLGTYNADTGVMDSYWNNNQLVGLGCFIAIVWGLKNFARTDFQGWFNNFSAIYQMVAVVVITATLIASTQTLSTDQYVWQHQTDYTGMSNTPGGTNWFYIYLLGLLSCLFSFSGYEASGHMTEETRDPSSAAPRGIIGTCICCALTGFLYWIGLLYATEGWFENNLNTFFAWNESSAPGTVVIFEYAFARIGDPLNVTAFEVGDADPTDTTQYNWTLVRSGALGLIAIIIIDVFLAGFTSLTVTARIAFAMIRDGALPGSRYMFQISEGTRAPVGPVIFCVVLDCVFVMINLDSSQRGATAFAAISSIVVIGYQISYAIPIFLRLIKKDFVRGKFHLGRWSQPVGWVSVVWLVCTSIIMLFPPAFDNNGHVTSNNFNYTCVVVGGTIILATFYWFLPAPFGARHFFVGPPQYELKDFQGNNGSDASRAEGEGEQDGPRLVAAKIEIANASDADGTVEGLAHQKFIPASETNGNGNTTTTSDTIELMEHSTLRKGVTFHMDE